MAPEAATGDIEMPSSYAEEVQPVQVVFDKVCIDVKLPRASRVPCLGLGGERPIKRILDQVSGIFGPAECTACMGPSGSGKTTLLNALTGVTKPSSGSITANGQSFEPAAMRRVSALVPQDDLLTPSLTTQEALMEATIFKTSLGLAERQARVDRLLKQFGLDGCKDVIIGHPEGKKGTSGGQKRRLSVALELCGRPSLLYLDEPTSGLDSIASMTLVRLLATLARGGVTVIATIHQPSAAAFYTFDRLLLLHQGSICYQGPIQQGAQPVAFFEGAGHPCPKLDNPADFLFEVLVDHAEKIRSKFQTEGVPDDAGRAADASLETAAPPAELRP
jgi:ABC-type multidrug transport system ATPase subunit